MVDEGEIGTMIEEGEGIMMVGKGIIGRGRDLKSEGTLTESGSETEMVRVIPPFVPIAVLPKTSMILPGGGRQMMTIAQDARRILHGTTQHSRRGVQRQLVRLSKRGERRKVIRNVSSSQLLIHSGRS